MVLGSTRLLGKMRFAEDRPNLAWGLCFMSIILRPRPPVIDIILEVLAMDELLYEGDALLSGVTDIFMEPAILILVPFGAIST